MKNNFLIVLLLGGLFLFISQNTFAKKVFSDVFIYKISNNVYSLNDLKTVDENLNALKCYYPDSLLIKIFNQVMSQGKNKSIFIVKNYTKVNYSKEQISYFKNMIDYHKLKFYSQSHKSALKKEIISAFYLASRQLNCPSSIFDKNKNFVESFAEVMKIEVFLRTRYLPEEKKTKNLKTDIEQALLGIKNLIGSIDKQVSEETYW